MSRSPLVRFESLLRRIVEEPFSWLTTESVDPYGLANHLLHEMENVDMAGREVGIITVHVRPSQLPDSSDELAVLEQNVLDYLELLAMRTGRPLPLQPQLSLVADADVGGRGAIVEFSDALPQETPLSTATYVKSGRDDIGQAIEVADAFLIVQGRQHIPLKRPVVRIGRRVDNDIVLDSAAVSRYHAQLQWRDNGYVLFDTSNHGRTWINGEAVQERRLDSGDVIALSDVLLVYGEGRESAEAAPEEPGYTASDTLLGP